MGSITTPALTRARATIALGLSACALALGAQPALADPGVDFAPGSGATRAAQQVAAAYWGANPCGGNVVLGWIAMDPVTNATSNWVNPVAAFGFGPQNTDCSITFNRSLDWDWVRFCSVLVHEYGHLTGRPHSPDPSDVMYAYYMGPVSQCVDAAAQGLPETTPAAVPPPAQTPLVAPVTTTRLAGTPVALRAAHRAKRAVRWTGDVVAYTPRRHHSRHRRHRR